MRRNVFICIAVALVGLASPVAMQQPPDFSGIWEATKDTPAKLPMAPSAIFGARFELRHTANTLTVIRPRGAFSISGTYEIGGPEVRLRSPGTGCQGDAYFIEVAGREGAALTFTSLGVLAAGTDQPTKANVKRFMHREGDTLVVEATAVLGGKSSQVGTVYKRSTEPLPPLATSLPATKKAAKIGDVAWVSGTWMSEPATEGASATEERWTPQAGGVMLAVARTLRGPQMSAFEFLCIAERDGSLVYNAMPNGRAPATEFVLTQLTADSATFENPTHDYPKAIKYAKRADGSLETTISGAPNQRVVTVVLKKQ